MPKFLAKSIKFVSNSEGFVFSSYKRCNEITLKEQYKDFIVPNNSYLYGYFENKFY